MLCFDWQESVCEISPASLSPNNSINKCHIAEHCQATRTDIQHHQNVHNFKNICITSHVNSMIMKDKQPLPLPGVDSACRKRTNNKVITMTK